MDKPQGCIRRWAAVAAELPGATADRGDDALRVARQKGKGGKNQDCQVSGGEQAFKATARLRRLSGTIDPLRARKRFPRVASY